MGFSQKVADEVLVRCRRHCCLCDTYVGTKIELHHIIQAAAGGEDTIDNCIPLCFNCHAEVKAYNPLHPKGRKFSEAELRGHRDKCYAKYDISVSTGIGVEDTEQSVGTWFSKYENVNTSRITWGFPDLDNLCTLLPGTIALIAGYTEAGKSVYAQQTMLKNLKCSNTVLYFHLKESSEALLNNIIAIESATKLSNLQRQQLTETDWERISDALSRINFSLLKFVPYGEEPSMAEQVILAAEKSNAKLIILDDFNALGFRDNSSVEIFLYRLKRVAAKAGVVVLILYNISQIPNRMDKHPMQQDVSYSALYRLCDIVQFLYQEVDMGIWERKEPKRVEVIVAKNHSTNIKGIIELAILPDIPIMCSIAHDTSVR